MIGFQLAWRGVIAVLASASIAVTAAAQTRVIDAPEAPSDSECAAIFGLIVLTADDRPPAGAAALFRRFRNASVNSGIYPTREAADDEIGALSERLLETLETDTGEADFYTALDACLSR